MIDRETALILVTLCRRVGGPSAGRRGKVEAFMHTLQDEFTISEAELESVRGRIAGSVYLDTSLPNDN